MSINKNNKSIIDILCNGHEMFALCDVKKLIYNCSKYIFLNK